ncbi:MAG: hypothetical protein ACI86H_002660 [bacterium]|jgi:hypothetical protein
MELNNIFVKDLKRSINGVVKAEQLDDSIVWQELDEYVVTKEIDLHLKSFIQSYQNVMNHPNDPAVYGKIGVWISGFFGSGKSHFLKILSYLLSNRQAVNPDNQETKRAIDFFQEKITDQKFVQDIKKCVAGSTDVILFNIDSKADQKESRNVILQVFLRVFNEMQGYCGEPHIANMERYLKKKGKLEAFHQIFLTNNGGVSWEKDRDSVSFLQDEVVDSLSEALEMSKESANNWFEKSEENSSISIEDFSKLVNEYIEEKGSNHRLLFMVDEIGQFIGKNSHLMLNLQTIAENLGTYCKGKAWVVVTSQEDIDAILGEHRENKTNDFSKIQGRFNTRLSLSSSNADEVIQGRLLEKTEPAKQTLETLFEEKGDILKNQLNFVKSKTTFTNFESKESFTKNFPFVPYQFQLIQKIFEVIPKMGATGIHLARGERSMIEAFQISAIEGLNNNTEENSNRLETLIPMYRFFSAIDGFLDTSVSRTVKQAENNVGLEPFDQLLLKTLFLIRYVDFFPPTVDNLVTLSIETIDQDRLSLRKQIDASLLRLEKETLINRNGDEYFFLTNEERDISSEIKNEQIETIEEVNKISELFFSEILKGSAQFRYSDNKKDYSYSRIVDGHIYEGKRQEELVLELITPLNADYDSFNESHCIQKSMDSDGRILLKFRDAPKLWNELQVWIQTNKYINKKSDPANTKTLKRILEDRADENRDRQKRLIHLAEEELLNSNCYIMGKTQSSKSKTASALLQDSLTYLVRNFYNKLSYLDKLHPEQFKELQELISNKETQIGSHQNQALLEVNSYIQLMDRQKKKIIFSELIERFENKPYGWPAWEIVILTTQLFQQNLIALYHNDQEIVFENSYDPITKVAYRKQISIRKRLVTDLAIIKKSVQLATSLFQKVGPSEETDLFKFIQKRFKKWKHELNEYRLQLQRRTPGKEIITEGLELCDKFLNQHEPYSFFQLFLKKQDQLEDFKEDFQTVQAFFDTQRTTWENLLDYYDDFQNNSFQLNKFPEAVKALQRMDQIIRMKEPYNQIHESTKLIETVKKINEEILRKARELAEKELAQKIEQNKRELDKAKADADTRNKVLKPLHELTEKVKNTNTVSKIVYISKEEAKETQEETMELLAESMPEPFKQTIEINPKEYLGSTLYLETEEEVETYLKRIKKVMLEEIQNGKRIGIK